MKAHSAPRVSVVIPVRNCRDFIFEAVESVLRQSFSDLELLVIDDGSDDWNYRQLESLDSRLRVLRLEGSGVSHARNTGMQEARGEFIAFLDADDVWFPGKLQAQINYFDRQPHVGVVFGGFVKWYADSAGKFPPADSLFRDCTGVITCETQRSGWIYTRLLTGLLVGMNTAVIRRATYEAVGGFNESMHQGEDYDFWLKASRLFEMHALAAPVALYRIHNGSAMHRLSSENHLAQLLETAALRWGLSSPNGETLSEQAFEKRLGEAYFNHGYSHFWHGDRQVARRSFSRAIRNWHLPFRCAVYAMLSYLPKSSIELSISRLHCPASPRHTTRK